MCQFSLKFGGLKSMAHPSLCQELEGFLNPEVSHKVSMSLFGLAMSMASKKPTADSGHDVMWVNLKMKKAEYRIQFPQQKLQS